MRGFPNLTCRMRCNFNYFRNVHAIDIEIPAVSFRVSVNFSTDILSFDPNYGAHWNRLRIDLTHSISAFIQPIIVIWSVTKRPSLVT